MTGLRKSARGSRGKVHTRQNSERLLWCLATAWDRRCSRRSVGRGITRSPDRIRSAHRCGCVRGCGDVSLRTGCPSRRPGGVESICDHANGLGLLYSR